MDEGIPRPMTIAKMHVSNMAGSYAFGFASRQLEDQTPRTWTTTGLVIHILLLLFVAYYTRDRITLWVGMTLDVVLAVWAMRVGISPL